MENANFDQVVNEIPETLRLPFTIWCKYGLFSKNKFKKYFAMTVFALCLTNLIIISMVQYINMKKDVSDFVRNLEAICGFTQILGKTLVILYRINDFQRLIEITKFFRKPNSCTQQTATKLSQIYNLISRLQKAYMLSLLVVGFLSIIAPLLEKAPPTGIWTLEGYNNLYYFVITEEIVDIPFFVMFLSSIDGMYLGFCTEVVVQFKILCHYLEELAAEVNSLDELELNYLNKIKTCIEHHQLMLWFLKKFQKAFSLILLIQYLTVIPVICAELFAAFEGHGYQTRARHALLFVTLTLQMSFYCITANYVADEGLALSNALYFSKWYLNHFPSLKVPLLLMMQNAQNIIIIKAGGLVAVNTATFINVLKVAWSGCTLARKVLRQN